MSCDKISPLAHRKQSNLTIADIPNGVTSIGDAAFSLCTHLKQITIPASVEHIGVAAFCGTGLETIIFNGVPAEIEPSLFIACEHLKSIIVPKGKKAVFDALLPAYAHIIKEKSMMCPTAKVRVSVNIKPEAPKSKVSPTTTATLQQTVPSELKNVRRSKLTYNYHDFSWAKGDRFQISDLLTGSVPMNDNISYQFRKKYLFVFMKSHTAANITPGREYSIPANTAYFKRKYEEKYGTRKIRIFLFFCNDGENAIFLDEVTYSHIGINRIVVSSAL